MKCIFWQLRKKEKTRILGGKKVKNLCFRRLEWKTVILGAKKVNKKTVILGAKKVKIPYYAIDNSDFCTLFVKHPFKSGRSSLSLRKNFKASIWPWTWVVITTGLFFLDCLSTYFVPERPELSFPGRVFLYSCKYCNEYLIKTINKARQSKM